MRFHEKNYNCSTKTTTLVTTQVPNYWSIGNPSLSPNGRQVLYDYSLAGGNVVLYDDTNKTTAVVSQNFDGTPGLGTDYALAADGTAAWRNWTSLVGVDNNNDGICDQDCLPNTIYKRTPVTGSQPAIPVSVATNGGRENGGSSGTVISENGRFVAFYSGSTNLIPEQVGCCGHIYLRDTQSSTTELISIIPDGSMPGTDPLSLSMSANGCAVVFRSSSSFYMRYRGGDCAKPAKNNVEPVIFIPGIAGSKLVDITDGNSTELWLGLLPGHRRERLSLYPHSEGQGRRIVATDILRNSSIYGPILDSLKQQGYVEYDVHNDPNLRLANCRARSDQQAQKPTLFVFAYDWRQDNAANANLLAEYIQCVRSYYPDHKVALLAHSMGGLIARRYITNTPNAPISTLITMGSSWVGAPKAIYALETGDLGLPPIIYNDTIKSMLGSFNGASQLLPSASYYDLAEAAHYRLPFQEAGWDVNNNKQDKETYSYNDLVKMLDTRYGQQGFLPGSIGRSFHSQSGQDNWSNTVDTISYYHLIGIQNVDTTIGQVIARQQLVCPPVLAPPTSCTSFPVFQPVVDIGDGTVPLISASRTLGGNYNAPQAQVIGFRDTDGESVEHMKLPSNSRVQQKIVEILQTIGNQTQSVTTSSALPSEETSQPASYLSLYGITSVAVHDQFGNSTEPLTVTSALAGSVPGVSILKIGDQSWFATLAQTGAYNVTFEAGDGPLALDLRVGTASQSTRHIVYASVQIPRSKAELVFTANGPSQLRYDSNGDGVMDQVVAPIVDVIDALAADETPPDITGTFQRTDDEVHLVLNVTDTDNAVASVMYSQDGQHFTPYTGPIALAVTPDTQVTVFATDSVGNQTSRILVAMPYRVDMPYISR